VKIFAELRGLVMLRRIARALEEQNSLTREKLAMESPQWARSQGLERKRARAVEFSRATPQDFNSRWREDQGLEPEELG
jgi:hypothetical protein